MSEDTRPPETEQTTPTSPVPETPDAEASQADDARPPGGTVLSGAVIAPGLVLGRAHRKDYDLMRAGGVRVPLDEIDRELNRFRRALDESRRQLLELRQRLEGRVPEEDARILDTHVTYLKDSVFIADVENLILNEQMRLDAAIAKVVGDFDRIFRLVQSDTLRQSAIDLRDVGIRVLRNLEREADTDEDRQEVGSDYVLIAKELSIVDMFNLAGEHVRGIVTEEGGMTSHAAIFARSMRIPTLTGVEGVLEEVGEGDFVILDATEGLLRVDPDEVVRAQYSSAAEGDAEDTLAAVAEVPEWARWPAHTQDGVEIEVAASCGNLPEVEQARALGVESIGLYRTELMYLIDRSPPSLETLVKHYSSVIGAAQGAPVTFRLLNVDAAAGLSYLHPEPARNPSLGSVGVRALLDNPVVLRRQLQALLLAGANADVRIALPFVSDCGDLRRVKEVLFEERVELRKRGEALLEDAAVGVVVETPVAMLGIRDLMNESDFVLLNYDSLQQFLLARDRDDPQQRRAFESVHPFVLRALRKASEIAGEESRPLQVFGAGARRAETLSFLIGAGLRHFCVPPGELQSFVGALAGIEVRGATRATLAAARGTCVEDARSVVANFHHGHARDD